METTVKHEKLIYSVPEAAKVLGIGVTTMYTLVKKKGFPVIVVGTRKLIPKKGLECWVDEQARKGWDGRYVE